MASCGDIWVSKDTSTVCRIMFPPLTAVPHFLSRDTGLKGFFGIALFIAVNSLLVFLYSTYFNDETEDEMMEFVKEGFMTAFASFMVSWILTYSAVSHPHLFASSILSAS